MSSRPGDLLIVFPPVFEPEMPYLSVPALAASLRKAGVRTLAEDLNLTSHEALLERPFLEVCKSRVEDSLAEFELAAVLPAEHFARYRSLVRIASVCADTLDRMPWALGVLRDPETSFDPMTFDRAMRVILRGFGLVSEAHFPARLGYGSFEIPGIPFDAEGLHAMAGDRERNPFVRLYETSGLIDALAARAEQSGIVGVSIVDSEQLGPGLAAIRVLKQHLPALRVVLGGPYLTKLVAELETSPAFFDLVDAVVAGEGEGPLAGLVAAWNGDGRLDAVPNLLWREGGRVAVNRPFRVEDVRGLPCPDFAGFPLRRYWSPEPVLPVQASRGCYWGRCTFCAHSFIYRKTFSCLHPAEAADRMAELGRRHQVRAFFFTDEGLSPPFVRGLAKALAERMPGAIWGMEARFEEGFDSATLAAAREGGLRQVVFGLESASERVLGAMRKGIRLDVARRIVDDCVRLGIAVHLWLIAGFPTETLAEAAQTLSFVFEHPTLPASPDFAVGLNRFALTRHCAVERQPEAFGIRVAPRTEAERFQTVSRFSRLVGMTEDELDDVFRQFDLLERSLPPDIRRTGRPWHMLRRDAGFVPGPVSEPEGPRRIGVRRSRFDLAEMSRRMRANTLDPLPSLSRPEPSLGVDLDSDEILVFRGRTRGMLEERLGERDAGEIRF